MGNVQTPVNIVSLPQGSFASPNPLYTVPGSTTFTVAMLHLVNTNATQATVNVCVVPSAGTAGISNAILWNFPLAPNDVLEIMKGDFWNAGTTLQAYASQTGVNLKLSGIQTT